ncbi:MAG: molybdate ABC transporter substrate-binding protein [Pseudomonadota bacterium]
MHTRTRISQFILFAVLGIILALAGGCSQEVEPLVVYAGKGLKNAMEEVKQSFEQQEGIPITLIYAGSDTLLTTLQKTHKGDVFIPGSSSYIKRAGELATTDQYVAHHTPIFAVRANTAKSLHSYPDLLKPGVQIAVGNKDMCAIGRIAEAILSSSALQETFRPNIVITGSTVNELLQLVVDGEVDAALLWTDMLQWPEAKGLIPIALPDDVNKPKEIRVTVLSTSTSPNQAMRFADFVATEGQDIFTKHGFGVK